jgi:hypothetical protein
MSGRILGGLDRDKCMEIATGDRWLRLSDDLDPMTIKTTLDKCYQILRAEA